MNRLSRLAAYVATGTLVASGTTLALDPAPASARPLPSLALTQGAGWVAGQLDHGLAHNSQYGFDDYGLSADLAFGLMEVGEYPATVGATLDAMQTGAHDNWYTSTYHNVTTTYAGSLAKLLVLAQEGGRTTTSFGGVDLVSTLEGRVASTAPIAGRIQDENNSYGDANVIGQAYAARGLHAAGSNLSGEALAFLLEQQCPNGGFRVDFTADKTAAGQSCTDNAAATTDATAIALQQLRAIGSGTGVSAAITSATTYLDTTQHADGSWGGGAGTSGSNSNSTGLAATALGGSTQSQKAAQWLRARQSTFYDLCDRLGSARGAFAYDDAALAKGRAQGITTTTQDQFRRASAQALPGLLYLPSGAAPTSSGRVASAPAPVQPAPSLYTPSGYHAAGSRVTTRTFAVTAGERLCLVGPGAAVQGVASGTSWTSSFVLPAGTATRSYRVWSTDTGSTPKSVSVLGATRLTLTRAAYRVARGHRTTVTIGHLARGERATLYFRHRLVGSGTAGADGLVAVSFSAGSVLGRKPVVAYGQFGGLRNGRTTVKVVR